MPSDEEGPVNEDELTAEAESQSDPIPSEEPDQDHAVPQSGAELTVPVNLSRLFPDYGRLLRDYNRLFSSKAWFGNLPDLARLSGLQNLGKVFVPNYSELLPRYDFANLVPRYDFAKLAGIDLTPLQSRFDVLKGVGTPSFAARLFELDLDQLIPKIDFRKIAERLEQRWREAQPPNWPDDSFDHLDLVSAILNDEGIPLVWVPWAEVVKELLTAPSRADRVAVLLGRKDDLIVDCQTALAEITHSELASQHPLAVNALRSYADGHDQPAQALAVLVTETAVKRAITGTYNQVKNAVKLDVDQTPFTAFRAKAALAPIASFFTTWHPGGGPAPTNLSRHVSVHQADSVHYTPENAILSILLMASVLRGLQETWTLEDPEQP